MKPSTSGSRDNARDKDYEEIAKSFVRPNHFTQATPWKNTVMSGPRGSGKTTMLKMLSAEGALARSRAQFDDPRPEFAGVYVPADPTWSRRTAGAPKEAQALAYKLLAVRSTARTISSLAQATASNAAVPERLGLQLTSRGERSLAADLGNRFGATNPTTTLRAWTDQIDRIILATVGDGPTTSTATDWLVDAELLPIVDGMTNLVTSHAESAPGRWVLLLDELELAPRTIFESVWSQLRAPAENWRVKLALLSSRSSAQDFLDELAPKEGHDFDPLRLASAYTSELTDFSERLLRQVMGECGDLEPDADMITLLGRSHLGTVVSGRPHSEVDAGSDDESTEVIDRLKKRDPEFAEWLMSHDISRQTPQSRKLRNKTSHLAAIRDSYNRRATKGPRVRTPAAYSGAPVLYALTEGNPRLIAWTGHGLCQVRRSGRRPISATSQGGVIQCLIERQVSVLSSIRPDDNLECPAVFDLVGLVGEHFRQRSTEGPFRADPIGSFSVNPTDEQLLRQLVGLGVTFGGFVEIAAGPADATTGQRRFRLHNLIAANFRLPVKIGKTHRITSIEGVEKLIGPAPAVKPESLSPRDQTMFG